MRNETQKVKLLYIAQILYEETDEQNILTGDDIVKRLREKGIACERKSVYSDLDVLAEFGMDIIRGRRGAYLASRTFEVPELKLLVDAVQSAKFITEAKSRELIGKLAHLTNRQEAAKFTDQVVVHDRVKMMNENIYYNIDAIHEAMRENRQITFIYYMWNADKHLVPKKGGERYVLSPWFFEWDNDKYYLVGFEEQSAQMRHYRVDKMKSIEVMVQNRLGRQEYDAIDLSTYGNQTFGMFGGETTTVRLLVDGSLAGAMIDHFGTDVWMHRIREGGCGEEDVLHTEADREIVTAGTGQGDKRNAVEGRLSVVIDTVVSDRFFGWIFGFGDKIEIVEPSWVRQRYERMLHKVLDGMSKNV